MKIRTAHGFFSQIVASLFNHEKQEPEGVFNLISFFYFPKQLQLFESKPSYSPPFDRDTDRKRERKE